MAISAVRRKKVLAILASGAVLGVGAAITLAAWNDSEFATGTFTAGSFNLEGSTNGNDFDDHNVDAGDAAATISFVANPDELSPGDVVYAPFSLQLSGDYNATLVSEDPVGTGDFATGGKLTFAAVETSEFGCNATSFGTGTAVPDTINTGETIHLCLQVTATGTIEQGDAGTVTWEWAATSVANP